MSSAVPTTSLADSADTVLPLAVQRKPRVLFLDVLRGIAVTVVLFQHLSEDVSQNVLFWGHRWINFGRLGVALFFLISGFVIPFSLERANSLRVFWVSRIFRLFPIYWFSLLVVLAYHFGGNYTMETEYHNHFAKTMLVNIFLIQQFVHVQHAIGLYWTLTLEMVFYVIFSVLFALGINKKSLLWCWCSIGLLAALGFVDHRTHHKMPTAWFGLLAYATFGTVIFRYYGGLVSQKQVALLTLGLIVGSAIGFGYGFRSPGQTTDVPEEWSNVAMCTSYFGAVLIFAAIYQLRSYEFAFPLRWLGTISYSIYLLHYPVWILWMPMRHKNEWVRGAIWELAIIGCTVVLSSITYLLIEKPGVELGKKLLHRPKPPTELGSPTIIQTPAGPVRAVTAA